MPMDSLLDLQRKWDRASRWYDFATVALEAVVCDGIGLESK